MKVINWNVGRPSGPKALKILERLNSLNGDIIVLTETHSSIVPDSCTNSVSTDFIPQDYDENLRIEYKEGENRTTIWTKYPINRTYKTYDLFTAVCAEIETPFGPLVVYATIIGVFNGKRPRFHTDLKGHLEDFDVIFPGKKVALIGDYNITFSGYLYPSLNARKAMLNVFEKHEMKNLTSEIEDTVDHIAFSTDVLSNKTFKIETWNLDKRLSDHEGFAVTISD